MSKKQQFSKVTVSVVLALVGGLAHAGDVFVSPSGNDLDAGTETAPYRTIQHALTQVSGGDTAFLKAGRYHEKVDFTGSVEVHPILLQLPDTKMMMWSLMVDAIESGFVPELVIEYTGN